MTNKVSLINTTGDIYGFGVRRLSSYLKKNNYNAKIIFCISSKSVFKSSRSGSGNKFSDRVLSHIEEVVNDSDVIGISVKAPTESIAVEITKALKSRYPEKIVIWGGVHPTTAPVRCLEFADYICIGEGEKPLTNFLNAYYGGENLHTVAGIWSKSHDGSIIKNPMVALEPVLDELSFPEFFVEGNLVVFKDKVVPLTEELEKSFINNTFWIFFTQGCPYSCSYCANTALINTERSYARVRRYSVARFIDYLEEIKSRSNISSVLFVDDCFGNLPENVIEEFCRLWKGKIGLPFHILGMHPAAYSEGKINKLIDAGLYRLRIGVQSGSERIRREVFRRRYSNDLLIEIAESISNKKLSLCDYDFILDNPWETKADMIEGLRLLSKMPPPFTLNLFHLTFFEGTDIYNKAISDGKISRGVRKHDAYFDVDNNYINFLYSLYSVVHIPERVLPYLVSPKVLRMNIRVPRFLFSFMFICRILKVFFYRVIRGYPTNVPSLIWLVRRIR